MEITSSRCLLGVESFVRSNVLLFPEEHRLTRDTLLGRHVIGQMLWLDFAVVEQAIQKSGFAVPPSDDFFDHGANLRVKLLGNDRRIMKRAYIPQKPWWETPSRRGR